MRQDTEPPVAQLIAEALDRDALICRAGSRPVPLFVEIGDQVSGRELVEASLFDEPVPRVFTLRKLAREASQGPAEFDRSTRSVSSPERQPPDRA